MPFVVLKPAYSRNPSEYIGDKVRIKFPFIQHAQNCVIYLGKDVASKYGIKVGEQYAVHLDTDSAFRIRLVKDPEGYTISKQGASLKLQMRWHEKVPAGYDQRISYATVMLVEGEMEISLPQANKAGTEG